VFVPVRVAVAVRVGVDVIVPVRVGVALGVRVSVAVGAAADATPAGKNTPTSKAANRVPAATRPASATSARRGALTFAMGSDRKRTPYARAFGMPKAGIRPLGAARPANRRPLQPCGTAIGLSAFTRCC
jgi:hypothetical protein